MYKFECVDDFWNPNLTWNSETPRLTRCLAQVGFQIIPSIIFYLLILFEFICINCTKNKPIRLNKFNTTRLAICSFAIIADLILLGNCVNSMLFLEDNKYTGNDVLTSALALIVFSFLLLIYHYHRICGIITSGSVFIITFLNTLCSTVLLLDTSLYNTSMYSKIEIINIQCIFLCNLCLFVFACITDDPIDAGLRPVGRSKSKKIDKKILTDNTDFDKENEIKISPERYASFISKLTFFCFNSFMIKSCKKPLEFNDIYDLEEDIKINNYSTKFNDNFYKEIESIEKINQNSSKKTKLNSLSMVRFLLKTFAGQILVANLIRLVSGILQFLSPIFLSAMINYLDDINSPKWRGGLIIIGLTMTRTISNAIFASHLLRMTKIGMLVKSSLMNLVYIKTLKISPKTKRNHTTGEIVNLISIDANSYVTFAQNIAYIWFSPIQIGIGMYLLYRQLDWAAFFAVFFFITLIYCQYFLSAFLNKYFNKELGIKDERIKLINELLTGIKIVKLYGWEIPFKDKISYQRGKEISFIKKTYFLETINWFLFSTTPILVLVFTIGIYIFWINPTGFTSERAFVSISIFNVISYPIEILPTLFSNLAKCKIASERISSFLSEDELEQYVIRKYDDKMAIAIKGKARFVWEIEDELKIDKKKPFELKDIELEIKKGSLVAVIGQVGSGKSSLISVILGEMHLIDNDSKLKGEINISDDLSTCYVAQQAWIQNKSFKENILFDRPFNKEKYEDVLYSCALESDLEQFEAGDKTEIGEKGINLSGGQKQRVGLARACYSSISSDNNKQIIVLLDDPLSAVDAHVGKHLCENVLNSETGLLKNTTRVLVTNQLDQLCDLNVDQIFLMKNGEIKLKCTYLELMKLYEKGNLSEFNLKLSENDDQTSEEENKDEMSSRSSQTSFESIIKKDKINENLNNELIEKEKVEVGRVDARNYLVYLKYFGIFYLVITLILLVIENSFQLYSRVYLADWTNSKSETGGIDLIARINTKHLFIFGSLSFFQCFFNLLASIFIVFGFLSAISLFHKHLLFKILRSPMSFFDTTPLGRIVNRFSTDIDAIDRELPQSIKRFFFESFKLLSSFFILIVRQPNLLIFYFLILIAYLYIMKLYVTTSRQLRRHDSTSKSPIFSHLSETFAGLSTIRAFNKTQEFKKSLESKIDRNNRAFWYFSYCSRWLLLNLNMMTSLIVFMVATEIVIEKEIKTDGDASLLISYALNVTTYLASVVGVLSKIETSAVSIERVNEYCNNEEEDEWVKNVKPDADWPKKGEIEFIDYSTKYREGTNLILNDLNFKVDSTEKVGIVGRTGAGKSTITLSLFRIIEPVNGRILIDNVDISQIGLHDLRSKLSIIPQDAVLFTGSIRFNLDPFDKYSDDEIYESLEHAHLKDYVNTLKDGIQHKIAEGGENLSIGQRQLICLARALLRKSKILVLDEATASIDFATDELVQNTIRSEFKDCTIITIAHRLKTVLDSDKMLVLDKGELKEYDEPNYLLKDSNSLFYSLASKANLI